MKRLISILMMLAVLVSAIPFFETDVLASTNIYFKPPFSAEERKTAKTGLKYEVTVFGDEGVEVLKALEVSNGIYCVTSSFANASNVTFSLNDSGNEIWMGMGDGFTPENNCFVFSEDENIAVHASYRNNKIEYENPLYFTPFSTWNATSGRVIVSFIQDGIYNYEEMTLDVDGIYATMNRGAATSYKFYVTRSNTTNLRNFAYTSQETQKNSPEENHFRLLSGGSEAPGEWSVKQTQANHDDEVSWGYSKDGVQGYTTLRDALYMGGSQKIYINLLTNILFDNFIDVEAGEYEIDLMGHGISSSDRANEAFMLGDSVNLTIRDSLGGGAVDANALADKAMFSVGDSKLEILGGIYRTGGMGIVEHTSETSQTTLKNATVISFGGSAVSFSMGKVTIENTMLQTDALNPNILYSGGVYQNNLNISAVDMGTTLKIEEPSIEIFVNEITESKLDVKEKETNTLVETIVGGAIYTIDGYCLISFDDIETQMYVKKHEGFTAPECNLVPEAGKIFSHWKDESGIEVRANEETAAIGNLSFDAVWVDAPIVAINFFSSGGSGSMNSAYATKSAPYQLPVCEFGAPYGKVFDKWKIGEEYFSAGDKVTLSSDTMAYATWKDGVPVTYTAGEGSGEDVVIFVSSGDRITVIENPFVAPSGKSFESWKLNGTTTLMPGKTIEITGETTIVAQWQVGYYVTYHKNDGSGQKTTKHYTVETEIMLPENTFAAPEGKMFKCWEINGNEYNAGDGYQVSGGTEIFAKWVDAYTITYVYKYTPEGGNSITHEKTDIVASGESYTIKSPDELFFQLADNFQPLYWREKITVLHQFGEVITVYKNYTLTLDYDIIHRVSLNPNNGEPFVYYDVAEGDAFTFPKAPEVAPEGMGFDYWEDSNGQRYVVGYSILVPRDMQFTAVWREYTELSKLSEVLKNPLEEKKIYKLPRYTRIDGQYKLVEWEITQGAGPVGASILNNELEVQASGEMTILMTVQGSDYSETINVKIYCKTDENGFCSNCGGYEKPELKDDFYQIKNAGNLYWFAQKVNDIKSTDNREINAILINDIDLGGKGDGSGRVWTPIGTTGGVDGQNFRGTFDGNNKTITGLYVKKATSGIGFFGEVRNAVVKNFEIHGDVVVPNAASDNTEYVGGVFGSVCGVDDNSGSHIYGITSYVNLTVSRHGVGRVGGFTGYANQKTLIENCSWHGVLDLGNYRAQAGVAGFIGRVQEKSNVTIRNCGAYGTVKTNYVAGSYNNLDDIYVCGFLGWSVNGTETNPTNTVIENCLFAGSVELGEDITSEIDYSAFGCLAQIKSITNCYYLGENGLMGVNNNSNYKPSETEVCMVDRTQLESGEVSYLLGNAWGQDLSKENVMPVIGGMGVYKYTGVLSNELKFGFAEYKNGKIIFNIPTAGEYSVFFADYEGENLKDMDIVTVNVEKPGAVRVTSDKTLSLGKDDKIILRKSDEKLKTVCDAYIFQ